MSSWNDNVIAQFRDNGGVTDRWGKSLVVMHTIGAKSGEERITPVMGLRDGDGWFVVASKGGAPTNPAWYHNLKANPTFDVEAHIEGEVRTVRVTAHELEGEEHDAAWERITSRAPGFAGYQERTTRRIPIFKLDRV